MIRNRYILKGSTWFLIFIMLTSIVPQQAFALTGGPSQPEVQSFAPIGVTDMVDPATGDFSYNIPLLEVGGYPINLAYNAGITMDDEASTVGLGWNINPGVINRSVKGIPDDFSGDDFISQTNIKPNVTIGVSGTVDFELFGKRIQNRKKKDGGNDNSGNTQQNDTSPANTADSLNLYKGLKSLKPTLGIEYNNYKGINLSFGISPSFKIGKILKHDRNLNLGSFGGSTKNGNSWDKAISITKVEKEEKNKKNDSSTGTKDKAFFRFQKARAIEGLKIAGMDVSKDILKKSYPDYFPTINNEFENYAFTANFMIPAELFGAAAGIRLPGYYVEQKLKAKTSTSGAYGTLYSEDGKNNKQALHDFNREKDIPFTKDVPNLPLTQRTFDVYSVAGQGISGSYKLKRGDVGLIYDNQASNMSAGGSVGFEIGGSPNLLRLGGDFHGNYGTTKTGPWSENFDVFDKLNFQRGENNNIDYEPAYFKSSGEISVTDRNAEKYYDDVKRSQPVSIKLDNNKNVKPDTVFFQENHQISNPIKRTAREKRNQSISYLTAKETVHQGLNKEIQSYPKNIGLGKNITPLPIPRTDNASRKDHHIGEITAVRPDGLRYVYGIPAYNNVQHEVSFNISGEDRIPICQDGTIAYSDKDNSIENERGTDHYYNRTTTPAHAHSYLLTAILSDDYSDLSGDGPSPDDLGSYTKINYTRISSRYKWRIPYKDANYNKGFLSDDTDDKASFQYGEKEYWVIHSIESKTQVAEFYYNNKGRRDARGVISESGGRDNDQKMEQLEKIVLYSRPDKYKDNQNGLEPIKSVHFEYDYSLCKGVPTNDGQTTNLGESVAANQGGKLTLKKVYFKYGKSLKGKFSPYIFTYSDHNPDYNAKAYNRWSTYTPINVKNRTSNLSNCSVTESLSIMEFPYIPQSETINNMTAKQYADYNVEAWNLKKIQLPSGALINVEYEADDYGFVQEKPAMQMMEIVKTSETKLDIVNPEAFGSKMNLFDDNKDPQNYLYFKLNQSFSNEADAEAYVKEKYVGRIKEEGNLYFNVLAKITDQEEFEYVRGYYDLEPNQEFGATKSQNGNYDIGFVRMKLTCTGDRDAKNSLDCPGLAQNEANPIAKAAWQFTRLNLPKKVNGDIDVGEETEESAFLSTLKQMANLFEGIAAFFNGGYNNQMRNRDFGKYIIKGKSWIRLYNPDHKKLAGTHRVKKITINDNWASMAGDNHTSSEYGQEYTYDMIDPISGQTISAGVAAYEPLIGGDENPYRKPDPYAKENKLAPDDEHYLEEPYGESFYPGANIVYRQVKVQNLQHDNITLKATGHTIQEFYTAYDFPTFTYKTSVQERRKKGNPILKVLKMSSKDHLTASQGYVIELNDMHGKPKSTMVYDQWGAKVSGVSYEYKSHNKVLMNDVKAIKPDGSIADVLLGVEYEMIADQLESKSVNRSGGVDLNNDNFLIGFFPIAAVLPYMSMTKDETMFRSIVLTKVITRNGILTKTTAFDLGSSVETRNLYYDYETGNPIVTQTFNEFEDPIYNFNYPAHWAYKGMASAYRNINASLTINSIGSGEYSVSNPDHFCEGDEIMFKGSLAKAWVSKVIYDANLNRIALINKDGQKTNVNGTDIAIKIIRSGHRNMASASIGSITSLKNPVVNNQLAIAQDKQLINAGAVEYNDKRNIHCNNTIVATDTLCRCQINENFNIFNEVLQFSLLQLGIHKDSKPNEIKPTHISWTESVNVNAQLASNIDTYFSSENCSGLSSASFSYDHNSNKFNLRIQQGECSCDFKIGFEGNPAGRRFNRLILTPPFKPSADCVSNQVEANLFIDFTSETDISGKCTIESNCPISNCLEPIQTANCETNIGHTINPFVQNIRGNYKPVKSYTYLSDRSKSNNTATDIVDIRKDGYYKTFNNAFWNYNPNTAIWEPNKTNWTWTSEITKVTQNGNEVESRDPLNRYAAELLGYHNQMVTAVAANARYQQIAFEGFEDHFYNKALQTEDPCINPKHFDLDYNELLLNSKEYKAHTGDYYLHLKRYASMSKDFILENCPETQSKIADLSVPTTKVECEDCLGTFQPLPGRYVISAWITRGLNPPTLLPSTDYITLLADGAEIGRFRPSGELIEGWQRVFGDFTIPQGTQKLTLKFDNQGTEAIGIDDIRIHPFDASFKSYVYDEHTLKFTYELDDNNYFTKYEYDASGNLERVKKETERGVMMIQESRFGQRKISNQ